MNAAAEPRRPFPWKAVMAAGLGPMRLSPKDFWSMTPREFAAALDRSAFSGSPFRRAELHALMRDYPDRKEQGTNG